MSGRFRRHQVFPQPLAPGFNYNDPRIRRNVEDGMRKLIQDRDGMHHTKQMVEAECVAAMEKANTAKQREALAKKELEAVKNMADSVQREAEAARREAEATRREAEASRREAEASRREAEAARREEEAAKLEAEQALVNIYSGDYMSAGIALRNYRSGAVVTSHGNMGAYAQSCIGSLITYLPKPRHIVLYINEGTDPLFDTFDAKFPEVEIIRNEDQEAFGGLTGTWNDGINKCLEKRCDVVLLVNGDTHVGPDVVHLTDAAVVCHPRDPRVFGPISNAPGPEGSNQCQASEHPTPHLPSEAVIRNKDGSVSYGDLNGFFLCFPSHVLRNYRHDETHCFDPAKPWAQNETSWYKAHCPHVYEPWGERDEKAVAPKLMVMPRTHVYHHKHAAWRTKKPVPEDPDADAVCVFTVVTGQYESGPVWSPTELGVDVPCYYLSDDPRLLRVAASQGWIPLLIGPWMASFDTQDPKIVQRSTKAAPHDVLPRKHTLSVYMDGNCYPASWSDSVAAFVRRHLRPDVDVVCWGHPDRDNVRAEAREIVQFRLEKPERVVSWMGQVEKWGFRDDQGLTETRLLIRRHHNLTEFADGWREALKHCIRDQLIFEPMIWKHKVKRLRVPIPPRHGGVVLSVEHSGAGSGRRYVT